MKMTHWFEYFLVRVIAFVFRSLEHRLAVKTGGCLGRIMGRLWMTRRRVVLHNLEIAFGDEKSAADRRHLTKQIFTNIGKTMAEVCRFPKLSKEQILDMVESEGSEAFREVLNHGKGAIVVGSHFGNWELAAIYINALGYPIDFLVRGQHNIYVDNYLTRLRKSSGMGVIHSEKGMKDVLRALGQNRQVAIVSDQHAGSNGIIVNFFNRPVSVPRAPATLAVRLNIPIVTGHSYRQQDDTHHCVFVFFFIRIRQTNHRRRFFV